MRSNTVFKVLLKALVSLRMCSICHFFTAQYMSECQEILHDTELLDIMLRSVMVRE
jgi:hypothetical protein